MATVVNQRDVLLLAASPRILPINLPSNVTVPKTQVTGLGTLASQNTVSQPDFAVGIEPVGLVSSLPNPVGYTGVKVVFNTSDGKLYRYISGAWTVAVPAVDVTGQLTNAQIADIAAAKLTGQITETQITDGAISTPKLLAGSVSTAKLAAGSVTTDILAANSVTAANIVAGQITAGKIAAGAVTANELAANSVIAGKISAGAVSTTEISASYVYAGNISANQITAGTISASVSLSTAGYIVANGQLGGYTISASNSSSGGRSVNATAGGSSGVAVYGSGVGSTTTGIYGDASTGTGVFGYTNTGKAIYGSSDTSGYSGYFTGGQFYVSGAGATFLSSTIEPIRSTSSSSSYAAGVFTNSSLGKQIALGGAYAAYAGSGQGKIYAVDGFTPFTGSHEAFISKEDNWEQGDIVYDSKVLYKHDISNTLTEVKVTDKANNKAVVGVLNSLADLHNNLDINEETWYNYTKIYDFVLINSVGEGMLNVCGLNGNIEAGDLICSSSVIGKGMKQSDDIVRSITVAKSRENVTFDSPEQVKQIACIYMCG